MSYYVYTYSDPSRLDLHGQAQRFYVGKGQGGRLKSLSKSGRGPFFLHYLSKMTRKPVVAKFDCASEGEAFELERFMIAEIGRRDIGHGPLTNLTDGGDGISGLRHTPETRTKMAAAWIGRPPRSAEIQAKITAALRGRKQSAQEITNRVVKLRGQKRSPEVCAKIGDAARGRTHTAETRAKLAEITRSVPAEEHARRAAKRVGQVRTPETRANISAALKGKPKTPEWRAKLAAAKLGVPLTDEARKNISAGVRASAAVAAHLAEWNIAQRGVPKAPSHRAGLHAARLLSIARKRGEPIPATGTPEYIAMRDALALKLAAEAA